ncbi:DUF922 domain-containing protein [Psychroserpens sp.]|uniref:DUF922 domain-containing protein n=1 Tax=Psychroserpens sp. TaxID=2020870 RepID=UPI001B0DFA29|nr:DUF922 domain-containing protein [Psychroserpens sp.]MBO6606909.1 DUF922 domain-containing protein [Psychroserpens sp.]MBO6631203.1 DUF922 domain-containing protein [Psychroserpens sp.]MBO6654055.1 DUF922 domain-containing protein [Psychroserpens sp.]MBO6682659.1 DUF922 domain-containing protein [Psychroserpens sp.]MBO6750681.1 DUF922 domain-containing protein [Psychroserpens sp.]
MYSKLILFLFIVFGTYSIEEETIEWRQDYKLQWSDFKGPVDANSDAVAVTASGITFSFSLRQTNDRYVGFESNAEAHFYPNKSWYMKESGNDHVLAHEQLHFDITELHVRQLRYDIAQLRVSQSIKQDLQELHKKANENLAKMQHAYDTQTQNSINKERQAVWAQFVKDELHKFSAYRSQ